ncbi:hypothetical protein GCM10007908_32890 [Rhizobium albus]|nr:hypothetical protein GCM10007908_32890 [Rhizobium albus]
MIQELRALPAHDGAREHGFRSEEPRHSFAENKRRVAKAFRILQIGNYLDRKRRQICGGQRQRVAMGDARRDGDGLRLSDATLSLALLQVFAAETGKRLS